MINEPVRFTLFVPKELKERLAVIAARRQVSAALLGRRALERFVRQEEAAKPEPAKPEPVRPEPVDEVGAEWAVAMAEAL